MLLRGAPYADYNGSSLFNHISLFHKQLKLRTIEQANQIMYRILSKHFPILPILITIFDII